MSLTAGIPETSGARVAVVTGGGGGIGAATAGRLANEGWAVAVLDLDAGAAELVAAQLAEAGANTISLQVDITDPTLVDAAIGQVHERLGPPLVLVNNAGILRDDLLFRMSETDWDDVIAVHLKGAFLMARRCQVGMVEAGWGRIVSISSGSAAGNKGQGNYAAAKAGVEALTRTLAIELGPWGITANAVAPGFVRTRMTEYNARRAGVPYEDFLARIADGIPARRIGEPEDIAQAVAFFVSSAASYVNGQVLYVGGGPLGALSLG